MALYPYRNCLIHHTKESLAWHPLSSCAMLIFGGMEAQHTAIISPGPFAVLRCILQPKLPGPYPSIFYCLWLKYAAIKYWASGQRNNWKLNVDLWWDINSCFRHEKCCMPVPHFHNLTHFLLRYLQGEPSTAQSQIFAAGHTINTRTLRMDTGLLSEVLAINLMNVMVPTATSTTIISLYVLNASYS